MKRILMIGTGGTIASGKTAEGLMPELTSEQLLSFVPAVSALCRAECLQLLSLDSTNLAPSHWLLIAKAIRERYDRYDGFVICHGTDTLAYTASALSYLIQRTAKPIVLTGAQRSIDEDTTDAKVNLLDSLRFACSGESGVCIVFGSHVIAGTRARKSRTKSYNAFTSLNFPDLASVHESRVVRYIPYEPQGEPVFYHKLNTRVFLLKLTPGMDPAAFPAAGQLCDGLIIESYGMGGIPDVYLEELDKLIRQGKTVIMATQVPQEGSDLSVYQVGKHVKDRYHLLETYDMTLESTVTKLMWILPQTRDLAQIKRLFYTPIACDLLLFEEHGQHTDESN